MGRQIAVAMTERDERNFLTFLRSTADIQIFLVRASAPDQFPVAALPPRSSGEKQFVIWNKAFPWTPDFTQSQDGLYYIKSYSSGPIIEYFRDSLSFYDYSSHGRIYWPKSLDVPTLLANKPAYAPYSYDDKAFNRWYEKIVRWIKANGKLRRKRNHARYYLPNAFLWHGWYIF